MSKELQVRISTEPFNSSNYPNLELEKPIGVELEKSSRGKDYSVKIERLNERLSEVAVNKGYNHIFNVSYLENATVALGDGYLQKEGDVLSSNIEMLDIRQSTLRALKDKGINTIGDLVGYSKRGLLRIPRVGIKNVKGIEYMLEKLNLSLNQI